MKLALVVAVAALVFVPWPEARAGTVSGNAPSLSLEITSSAGGDPLQLAPTLTANPNGTYSAVGEAAGNGFSILFDLTLNPDPAVSGSFTLQNLSGATQTFSVSATLGGLLPIAGPTSLSGFYGPATFTDLNDSSVTLSSALFYQALIDGTGVKGLGSFSLDASGGAGVFGQTSMESFGPEAGPGVASSIGVRFPGFDLTAGDKVEVPFEFSVVPEPGFASLCAIASVVFLAIALKKLPG